MILVIVVSSGATDITLLNDVVTTNKSDNILDNIFKPAKVERNSFDSMIIGYQSLYKEYNNTEKWQYGIFFSLETGWSYLQNILLFSINIDGTAGGFYGLNGNFKLGARVLDGRLIPSISVGYGLVNHVIDDKQYNMHGSIATFALFVDIGHGVGLELAYRTTPYPFIGHKGIRINKMESFILNIKFINFGSIA